MSSCPKCKSPHYVKKCMECLHAEEPKVKKGQAKCEWPCEATVHVQESGSGKAVQGVVAYIGTDGKGTDSNGFRTARELKPGQHAARISLIGLEKKYARPIGSQDVPVKKTIAQGKNEFFSFVLDPLAPLKVVVKRRHDSNGLAGAKVTLAAKKPGNAIAKAEITTPNGGEALFEPLRQDNYSIKTELSADLRKKYRMEKAEEGHALDMARNPDECVVWARLVIHLKLKYKDPDGTARPFPKDFPVQAVFDDGKKLDLKILDAEGKLEIEIEDDKKKKFTLKFDSAAVRYLVHEADKPAAEVKEDPSDADLWKLHDAGKRFFALPKAWSLAQSDWDKTGITVPADGQIDIPADGIGASDAPAELTLKPALQYARFEFFDRKYCESDHNKKAVSIPPVILKGARASADDGAPENPVAGTHDAISNWFIEKDDLDKACQALPFILTRAADGAALPKPNNKWLLEFGREKAFVHSAGAKDRKLVILADDDAKRKPSRERNQYYDLPKLWKSKCYYTRFADASKNRFFDELAAADDPELEASFAPAGRLVFSLDDIVLVEAASQDVKDKGDDTASEERSEHSRITVLTLDPKDKKYNVVVHKPRPKATYWSDYAFKKEAAGNKHRNAIVEYPINPRAVVFCSEFYDVWDKRTGTADFTKKEILGARAAKLDDADISGAKKVFNQQDDVDKKYVHLLRTFPLRYLHFAGTDGTTVFGMLVTYFSCRFKKDTAKGGTDQAVTVFREEGMERAMKRWNEKDYFFEESDDKQDLKIKHFCLFEAKDVETSVGQFEKRGGKQLTVVTVKDDSHNGSSATSTTMVMRRSGALDEGDDWGNDFWPLHPPNHPESAPRSQALTPIAEYDVGNASPASAFAHELGHAAIGAWDDYVTGGLEHNGKDTELWKYKVGNADMEIEGQRYPGMPYEADAGGIMNSNRSVRIRYFWGRANWLNDLAEGALEKFLAKRRFRIAYKPADTAKQKLVYSKPKGDKFRGIYKPVESKTSQSLGKNGKCDLHLYHLGEDEFSRVLQGGPYTGVLALCLKLSARFLTPDWAVGTAYKVDQVAKRNGKIYLCKQDHTPALVPQNPAPPGNPPPMVPPPMNPAQWDELTAKAYAKRQKQHCESINKALLEKLQGKFKLQGNGNFSTTYIRMFPQWEIVEPNAQRLAGTNFELEFEFGSDKFAPTGDKIVAGTKCKPITLIRYFFGKIGDSSAAWPNEGGLEAELTKDDFPKIKEWMDANAEGRFNVGAI